MVDEAHLARNHLSTRPVSRNFLGQKSRPPSLPDDKQMNSIIEDF